MKKLLLFIASVGFILLAPATFVKAQNNNIAQISQSLGTREVIVKVDTESSVKITIYDLLGKEVAREIIFRGQGTVNVDIAGLKIGTYAVVVSALFPPAIAGKSMTGRFSVQ